MWSPWSVVTARWLRSPAGLRVRRGRPWWSPLRRTRRMPRRPESAGSWSADMSVGVDEVDLAVGAGPHEGGGADAVVAPRGEGLQSVVVAAQGRQVPALGATDRPFDDVVRVGTA